MPSVASTIRIGYSNRSNFSRRTNPTDMAIAAMEPTSVRTFIRFENGSTTKAPSNISTVSLPPFITKIPATTSKAMAKPVTVLVDFSFVKTPTINNAMAPTAITTSGMAGMILSASKYLSCMVPALYFTLAAAVCCNCSAAASAAS